MRPQRSLRPNFHPPSLDPALRLKCLRKNQAMSSQKQIRSIRKSYTPLFNISMAEAAKEKTTATAAGAATGIGITDFTAIPMSGFRGDNIAAHSDNMAWYGGPPLLAHLETTELDQDTEAAQDFCMPVQWVNRPHSEFRGFSGRIKAGTIKPGDEVRILPSGKTSHVDRIVTFDGDLDAAGAGQSITLTLTDEVDCSRGQIITAAAAPLEVADQFETILIWMEENH